MAINQLKAGALLAYVSLGLNNVIGLLYTPFLLRKIGQSEFGLYSLAISVMAYLTMMDFGLGNAVVRYTAKFRAEGKIAEQYALFGLFFKVYSVIGVVALVAGLGLYFNAEHIFGFAMNAVEMGNARIMTLFVVISVAISFPLSVFGSINTAYECFTFQRLINIGRIILNPLIMIPLLLLGYKSVGMIVLTAILNLAILLVNVWYCFVRLKIRLTFEKLDWIFLKEIAGYSFFIFLSVVVDRIYWNSGQFVLGIQVGTAAVAVFAITVQLSTYYMSFSGAIMGVFLPKVTAMVAQNVSDLELSNLFIRVGRIEYLITAFIFCGFILFGKEFVLLWIGAEYSQVYLFSLIIMFPLTIPLVQNMGIIILQARNRQKFRSYLYVAIALLNLIVTIPLAKTCGGIGCALGISGSIIIGHVITINVYYYKRLHLDIIRFWREIFRMTVPILIVMPVGIFLNFAYKSGSLLSLGIKICIFSIIYLPAVWRFGMNDYERIIFTSPWSKFILKFDGKH